MKQAIKSAKSTNLAQKNPSYFEKLLFTILFGALFCADLAHSSLKTQNNKNNSQNKIAQNPQSCELSSFTKEQKNALKGAFVAGSPYNFGYELAAIAWKESCAGVFKMNFQDPSAGLFHAYLPGVLKRYPELSKSNFSQNAIGAKLVEDDEFAAKVAIDELLFWQKTHKNDLKKMIMSYNKGYSWQKDIKAEIAAENYYADISQKIQSLKLAMKGEFEAALNASAVQKINTNTAKFAQNTQANNTKIAQEKKQETQKNQANKTNEIKAQSVALNQRPKAIKAAINEAKTPPQKATKSNGIYQYGFEFAHQKQQSTAQNKTPDLASFGIESAPRLHKKSEAKNKFDLLFE